jgi:hypothetical protein
MPHDDPLRENLLRLLSGGGAHAPVEAALAGWPAPLRGVRPARQPHTAWRLLEHLRIAQWDILEFCRDPEHVSPAWPEGYWPEGDEPPDPQAWDRARASFLRDLEAMKALVADPSQDLLARIPHTEGATLLREALLVADHNAYHQGQLVLLRRLLGLAAHAEPTGGEPA